MTAALLQPPPENSMFPAAELILPANASRAEWLRARTLGIGGSDMAALKGDSRYGTAYSVWLDKTDRNAERLQTKRMRRGQLFEDAIAVEFAEDTGFEVIGGPGLLRSLSHPRMLATPDRIARDKRGEIGGLEVKYVESYGLAKQLLDGEWPGSWWWQMVTYLAVTGLPWWRLAALVPNKDELLIKYIPRSDVQTVIDSLGPFVEDWWTAHIEMDVPPADGAPKEPTEAPDADEVEALLPHVVGRDLTRLREINVAKRALDGEETDIRGRLSTEIGTHRYLTVFGRRVVQQIHSKGRKKFNQKAFAADYPDLEAKYVEKGTPSNYVKILESE